MKAKLHVLALDDNGESVKVTAQGSFEREAGWRPNSRWEFKVPDYVGRRWRIGTELTVTVKAKP
jgi:hypothetical protein